MTTDTINDAQTVAGNGEGTILAGRYRIVRQLGAGGMGSVWLAEDTQLDNKQFAIKMLPAILVANKRAYRQLKDEALVAMRLVHPNIVQIRAFEENNGNPFLVMDYIDGQTLDDYLADKGKLSEDEVVKVLRPIAAALDYAHGEGVVHRDVKPANVMIRKDGHPFILDFGIAREIQETLTRVTGKLSSGTLLYMSPEQLMGEHPKSAQDIYSFAAMAYECLKGEPPFVRGAIEDQIKNKLPDPLPVGRGILSVPLAASVMVGLAKKAKDRPRNCAAVLEGDKVVSRRGAEAQRNLNGGAESVGRGVPAASHGRAGSPLPAEIGRARSPIGSQPQGGVVASGSAKISVPKSDWPYLPPDMRPHPGGGVGHGVPAAPKTAPGFSRAEHVERVESVGLPTASKTDAVGRARSPSAPLGGVWKMLFAATALAFAVAAGLWWKNNHTPPPDSPSEIDGGAGELWKPNSPEGISTNQLLVTNQVIQVTNLVVDTETERISLEKSLKDAAEALGKEDAEKARKLLDAASASSLLSPEQSKYLADAKDFCALLEYAIDGDVKAQTVLAEAYYGGRGFAKRNLPRAHLWYTIAANSGGGKAQLALAVMYDEGQGVKPNPAEASVWFRKAAESGEPDAMYRVGIECYKTGGKAEANSWFRRAKDAGSKIENIDKWIKVTDSSADNTGGKTSVTPTHDSKAARQEWRKAGEEFTINEPYGLNLTMKWCPAGTFTMGSPESEEGRNNDEREHRVTLSKGFWMGETEVTQGQWKKIMDGETVVDLSRKALLDDNEYFIAGKKQTLRAALNKQKYDYDKVFGGNDKDVIDQIAIYWVSWYDAVKFCNRLTQSERKLGYLPDGYEYRLPTEAEWEYSCRANTTSALPNGTGLHMIDMGNATALDSIAWYRGNSTLKKVSKDDIGRSVQIIESSEKSLFLSPQEVKGKQPNAWGLYDMIGNLLEWCGDWYGEYPYGLATDTTGAERGADRVLRGGSWIDFARLCRSAARRMGEPGFRSPNLGFRVALAPKLPEEYRKAVQAELQKANVVIRHEQYPTPGTKRESEQEGKAVNLKNERVKAMDNSIFYDRNKKFDEHKAFDAYKSMCSNFGYPFENVVNVANKQGLGFGFWSVDYMKGAFANCGLGGIVRENDIKEEKSEIEYFLLPGQSQVEYRMLPTHAKIKHHKTGQFFEKDLPAKKSRWLVKHGWVYYFSSVGTANLDSYPEIKASISSVFRSVLKSVHVERWDADGQIHEVEGVSHWQFLMGGDEGAVVIEYGNYHDGSGFRFSVSGVGF